MANFIFLSAKNYISDLTLSVKHASNRVYITCPVMTDDPATHELVEALLATATRGVEVNMAVDAFTFAELGGYVFPLNRRNKASREAARMADRLATASVSFHRLGDDYKLNPFAGVTHTKWCVVDDAVYSFGGTNLYEFGLSHVDYMLRCQDSRLAQDLINQQQKIITSDRQARAYHGYQSSFPLGTVYIDSGQPGNSAIYERACELASKAQKITLVSQYCPSGPLAALLRQKNARVYFNQPINTSFYTRLFIYATMRRAHLRSLYKKQQYIHAKFIIFEMPSGQTIALTGSHNFSYGGVKFGTKEIALETTNRQVCRQLEEFLQKNIA